VYLVGFYYKNIYHDARSSECQIYLIYYNRNPLFPALNLTEVTKILRSLLSTVAYALSQYARILVEIFDGIQILIYSLSFLIARVI